MGRNTRVPATKACDYCRLRKVRCIASEDRTGCKTCSLGHLECSYIIPNKRRGPPPKRRHIVEAAPGTKVDESTPQLMPEVQYNLTDQSSAGGPYSNPQSRPVHRLVSCPSFDMIVQDYLDVLYALIPVVHIPTFISNLRDGKHHHDLTFQMFCLAICACVFGILPHKFEDYTNKDASIDFTDRRTAVADIHRAIVVARPPEYYDDLSHEKWAISFLMSVTNAHLGHRNRAKVQFAESSAVLSELGMHRIASYRELDHVDTQIRKKAFWLSFIGWSHSRTRDIDYESMADQFKFETADAEHLIPLEIDDEYITPMEILPQPAGKEPLVSGFNAIIRISDCLVPIFKDTSLIALSFHTGDDSCRLGLGTCACGKQIQKAPLALSIMARMVKATHILENLPSQLSSWGVSDSSLNPQFEIMTANIHVTHVWVQSLLLERLIAVNDAGAITDRDQAFHQDVMWKLRESIWEQLMDVLNNISEANLKPNGYVLIVKARTIASTLLGCTLEGNDTKIYRGRAYLQSFADILARLDESYSNDNTSALWKEFYGRF